MPREGRYCLMPLGITFGGDIRTPAARQGAARGLCGAAFQKGIEAYGGRRR